MHQRHVYTHVKDLNENDIYLYVFGRKTSMNNYGDDHVSNYNLRWKLRLTKQIDWNIERLIWIGYCKNSKDKTISQQDDQGNMKQCIFGQIPKDVIKSVLSFIRRQFCFLKHVFVCNLHHLQILFVNCNYFGIILSLF